MRVKSRHLNQIGSIDCMSKIINAFKHCFHAQFVIQVALENLEDQCLSNKMGFLTLEEYVRCLKDLEVRFLMG